jgi:hypothetical protein
MQNPFFGPSGHSRAEVSGRADFWADRSHPLSCRARKFFFGLSGHSRAAVSGRAVFGLTGRIRTAVSARAATFSFAVRSPPRRNVRARRNLFRLSGRILAAQQIFFGCPVASAQQSARAEFFFGRAAFSFAVRSHLRRTF